MVVRRGITVVIALLLVLVSVGGVAAQGGPVATGEATSYVDVDGVEHGTVTVTGILDPYTGFPQDKGPEAGTRFVIVTLSIEGTGPDGIEVYPPSIWLQDATGALWERSLPCCIMDEFAEPELTITTVAQGSRLSGYIGYTLPSDAVVQAIVYQVASGVVLIPADLGSARPPVGTAVTVPGADGTQMTGTITKIEDPFKGFAKDRRPAKGARYVMVTASFENAGDGAFEFQTNGTLLRDVRGALWGPTDIATARKQKSQVIKSVDLGPGNHISGRLGFQVPADIELEGIYYQGGGHLTRLAALSDPGTAPPGGAHATCADITPWWAVVSPILVRLTALPPFQADAAPMDLAASRQLLGSLELIVADHLAVTPPDPLVAHHRRILGALLLYERSAQDQVAAQEGSDAATLFRSQETFEAAQLTMSGALGALDEAGLADCDAG